jgi:hypothetical protein
LTPAEFAAKLDNNQQLPLPQRAGTLRDLGASRLSLYSARRQRGVRGQRERHGFPWRRPSPQAGSLEADRNARGPYRGAVENGPSLPMLVIWGDYGPNKPVIGWMPVYASQQDYPDDTPK